MITYLNVIIFIAVVMIVSAFVFYIFLLAKVRRKWSRERVVISNILISIFVLYCLFILLLPWPYLMERTRGLKMMKDYHFKRASLHFSKARQYRESLGIFSSVFKSIIFIQNDSWHMNDDLDSWILKCEKFQAECVSQPERFKMCHPED